MKKTVLLLLMFFTLSISAYAIEKSAYIRKVWIEHGVTQNNKQAMRIHCDFDINGMKGQTGYMGIWVKNAFGRWHNVNGNASDQSGYKFFQSYFMPGYDNTTYSDLSYTPYIDQLNLLSGKNEYKVVVCIFDNNMKKLAQSNEISFTGTGSQAVNNRQSNQTPNNTPINNANNIVKEWREELGYGGFAEMTQYSNGLISRVTWRNCPTCSGHGKCTECIGRPGVCRICDGTTNYYKYDYYGYLQCTMCMLNPGRCFACGGSAECKVCKNSKYKGKVIHSSSTMTSDGRVLTKDRVNYNGYDGNGLSSPSENKTNNQCTYCGGNRINPNPCTGGCLVKFQAPNTVNRAGERCRICNYGTFHHHDRCQHCNVPER